MTETQTKPKIRKLDKIVNSLKKEKIDKITYSVKLNKVFVDNIINICKENKISHTDFMEKMLSDYGLNK